MTRTPLRKILFNAIFAFVVLQSCKDDSYLSITPPPPDQSFSESFDDYNVAYNKGWRSINTSSPIGRKWYDAAETPDFGSVNYLVTYYPGWNQAQFTLDSAQFPYAPFPKRYWMPAYASQIAVNGYVATSIACAEVYNFYGASGPYNVSCWLTSPPLLIKNGDTIVFYTYCKGLARLQLWINPTGSLNVGTNIDGTGDFNLKILDINPDYASYTADPAHAFPISWTRFEGTVNGLSKVINGRFGFRYILQQQDPLVPSTVDPTNFDTLYNQVHQSVIGIDEVSFRSAR